MRLHDVLVVSVALSISPLSAGSARAILRDVFGTDKALASRIAGMDIPDDAALMLSELVTNAVRYSRGLVLLQIRVFVDTLYIAVIDDTPDLPLIRHPDPDDATGRGIGIVDALADRWGTTLAPGRKSVWFELTLP